MYLIADSTLCESINFILHPIFFHARLHHTIFIVQISIVHIAGCINLSTYGTPITVPLLCFTFYQTRPATRFFNIFRFYALPGSMSTHVGIVEHWTFWDTEKEFSTDDIDGGNR